MIAVDTRAHGRSADPGDSLSFEMIADDFNALLDSLHTGPIYFIGCSDGGIDGVGIAMRHPEKLKKMAITRPAGTHGRKRSHYSNTTTSTCTSRNGKRLISTGSRRRCSLSGATTT